MRILVTGGAGFIGSHSVEALLARGCWVRVLDNLSTGKRANLVPNGNLEFCEGDIRDARAVQAACQSVDAVLHLAAQVSVQASIATPTDSASHNVVGFLNVADAVRLAGIKRMVYASSAAVYGVPAKLPVEEADVTRPISPYGLEKLINDQYAALFSTLYGTAFLGMRYFNVYGPRQDPRSPYAGVISKFVDAALANEPVRVFGDGLQTRDFVYVKDVARANVAALTAQCTGVVNIGTGTSVTLLEMVSALESALQRPIARVFEAPVAGDIQASAVRPQRQIDELDVRAQTPLAEGLAALIASGSA